VAEKSTQHYLRSFDVNEKLISSIDSGIIILDENLTIHYYNYWLEIHSSLKESDLLEKNICHIFDNINEKTLTRKVKTALRMGTPTFYTASTSKYLIPIKINQLNVTGFEHMRQDVSIIPFDIQKRLVALIITDQTNMTNTNALLQANILKVQDLNRQLIKERETIDNKVLLIKFNITSTITDVSQAYINLTNCEKSTLLRNNFFEYQRFYLDDTLKKELLKHMDEQKVFKFENTVLKENGEEIFLFNTLVPEYDSSAQHVGFILFMENISASKRLIKQQEKLLATSRTSAMGEMISMIAHQWRQPLSVINTILATLKLKQELNLLDASTTQNSFKKIEDTVKYLSTTIDDFRDYFKPNKVVSTISINSLVNKSTSFLLQEMKTLNISYRQEIDTDITIKTYRNELIQCIINILKNSMDAFSEHKIKEQSIVLRVKEESTYLSLSFSDNAGGIDTDIIKRVFEPYFSTKAKNGTGLGLYMTKTIIEEHLNGKITIKSSNAETCVLIELPYMIQKKENK